MTPDETTVVAGIPIPSTSPVFLAVVALHVLVGLVCVVAGAIAILSRKRSGRHRTFGTIYYWALVVVFVSATGLSVVRWAENCHLFILGLLAFVAARWGAPPGDSVGADGCACTSQAWAFPTFFC